MIEPLGKKDIHQLIAELCPNGCEYKKLESIAKIRNGKDWKAYPEGDIPVYGSGGIMRHINTAVYKQPSVLIPRKGSIGNLFYTEGPFWTVDTVFYTEIRTSEIVPKFLYYVLSTMDLTAYDSGAALPSLTQTTLNVIAIPVPPLPIQEAIVAYLDKFAQLEAELEAELVRREKQYGWYRMHVLDFKRKEVDEDGEFTGEAMDYQYADEYKARPVIEKVRQLTEQLCPNGVEWRRLGELVRIPTGKRDANFATPDGAFPFYTCSPKVKKSSGSRFEGEALIVPGNGNIGIVLYHPEGKFDAYQRVYVLQPHAGQKFNLRFLYHMMLSAWSPRIASEIMGGAMPYIKATHLNDFQIPVPPLPVQEAIVELLDAFDTLISDAREGLPAEIRLRRKQYEYYREQLLTFDSLEPVDDAASTEGGEG